MHIIKHRLIRVFNYDGVQSSIPCIARDEEITWQKVFFKKQTDLTETTTNNINIIYTSLPDIYILKYKTFAISNMAR